MRWTIFDTVLAAFSLFNQAVTLVLESQEADDEGGAANFHSCAPSAF